MIVTVRHNIEVAHRFWTVPGKCHNLHGHGMWINVEVAAHPDQDGVAVEFGAWKAEVRQLLDDDYDHGAVLHPDDVLADVLEDLGSKVYRIPAGNPTVENLAADIARRLTPRLHNLRPDARLVRVRIEETTVNGACWTAALADRALP